jgi:hypothetical protein
MVAVVEAPTSHPVVRNVLAFAPAIPQTNMVHGYLWESDPAACRQALHAAEDWCGIRVLDRVRPVVVEDIDSANTSAYGGGSSSRLRAPWGTGRSSSGAPGRSTEGSPRRSSWKDGPNSRVNCFDCATSRRNQMADRAWTLIARLRLGRDSKLRRGCARAGRLILASVQPGAQSVASATPRGASADPTESNDGSPRRQGGAARPPSAATTSPRGSHTAPLGSHADPVRIMRRACGSCGSETVLTASRRTHTALRTPRTRLLLRTGFYHLLYRLREKGRVSSRGLHRCSGRVPEPCRD